MATATEEPSTTATDEEKEAADLAEAAQRAAAERAAAERENHAALERAVADLPEVPGRDEFLTLCQMARVMAGSGVVPKALRDKPADVLVVLMTGRDLGIPVTAALRKVYVIEGQPSIAPQLKLSLIRKKGLGRVVPHPHNDRLVDRQGAIPLGPGGTVTFNPATDEVTIVGALGETYWYTWDDAIRAGLVRGGCTPDVHTAECDAAKRNRNVYQTNDIGLANHCKDNWRKNPRRLLWQRASGFCADDYFSEATLGLYDPDELGAILDDDGKLIDANHVEVPEGFGPAGGGGQGGQGGSGEEVPVDPADAWDLQLRVFAMPEDAQAEFRQRWVQQKVAGSLADDPGHEPPRRRFAAAKLNLVSAMLRGVEQQWKAQRKYDPDTGPAAFAENVLGPSVLHWLALPYGGISFRATPPDPDAAKTPASTPQAAPAAPEPETAADAAPGQDGPAGAAEATVGPLPDGALPLALPEPAAADPTDALLVIPDEVRAGTVNERADWVIGHVKAMSLGLVDELLRRRYEADDKGTPNQRRARLAELVSIHELGEDPASGAGPR